MSRGPQLPKGFHEVDFTKAARNASSRPEYIRLLGLRSLQKGYSVRETAEILT